MRPPDLIVPQSRGYFPGPDDPPRPSRFGPRPFRITVARYHTMILGGAFADEPHVELIDGELTESAVASPLHDYHAETLADVLRDRLPTGWGVRRHKPLTLRAADSEPEPDAVVTSKPTHAWSRRHPTAADALLVAEAADVSLHLDRTRKAAIYAAAGISPYWIVNLPERMLEVRTDPRVPADGAAVYRTLRTYDPEETVVFALAGREFSLPVAELLPGAEEDDAPADAGE